MKGIMIRCPYRDCRKPLINNAYLRIGSYFLIKCFHCGVLVDIRVDDKQITLKIAENPNRLTEDEDEGIIFMHS